MKVFITGVTGYVGFNVACAFRRAGHEVWGLVRDESKVPHLLQHEIHSVIGTLQKTESFKAVAEQCPVLIHAAADHKVDTFSLDRMVVETLASLGEQGVRPKTIIYTSGVWVHGDTRGKLVDEATPTNPPRLVARRPATEDVLLGARTVRGIIIRPGCVYGKQGGLTGLWFRGAVDGALKAVGDGSNHWSLVHVDDLAEAYVRAAESGISGEIFNVTDGSSYTARELATAAATAAGYRGDIQFVPVAEAAKTYGDLAECLALDQHVDARKAMRRLGWWPRHRGFVDEPETYFASWNAAQSH